MKRSPQPHSHFRSSLLLWKSLVLAAGIFNSTAFAEPNRVRFPEDLERMIHYATVTRGESTERMLTTQSVLDAIRQGKATPSGSRVVLADFRDGKPYRYFVMEKGEGWGKDYDERRRTADWQFQWFWPDKSLNLKENTARCQSCHQSREDEEYLYTAADMRKPARQK